MTAEYSSGSFFTRHQTLVVFFSLLLLLFSVFFLLIFFKPVMVFDFINQTKLKISGFKSSNVKLDSVKMHYWVGGKGDPIILISGIGGKGDDYSFLMPELARKYKVYAVDLIGFGESDKPMDADYSIGFQARYLLKFLDKQKIEKAIFVGNSMGGWVSLMFCSLWPERVNRMFLAASPGVKFRLAMDQEKFAAPENVEELSEIFRLMASPLPPGFILKDLLKYFRNQSRVMRSAMRSMTGSQDNLDGKLNVINFPVVLVYGLDDKLVPVEVGYKIHKEIPGSKLMVFEKCGHGVMFECQDKVLPELRKFLY